MNNDLMFSSKKNDWDTPQWLFDHLNEEYKFALDCCAESESTKCEEYISKEENALTIDWSKKVSKGKSVWMNSPYGRTIHLWMKMAVEKSLKNYRIVCLLPSRTDTKYWHNYVTKACKIKFIKGRLIFGSDKYWEWVWEQKCIDGKKNKLYKKYGKKNAAPFPSAIAIFDQKEKGLLKSFGVLTPHHEYLDLQHVKNSYMIKKF